MIKLVKLVFIRLDFDLWDEAQSLAKLENEIALQDGFCSLF